MASVALAMGLSGGLASTLARAVVWPVDVVRTTSAIHGREAVASLRFADLWRGLSVACIDAFAYHAANFGAYSLLHALWKRRHLSSKSPPVLLGLLLGMISGAVAQLACQPFTTLSLRMSAAKESLAAAFRGVLAADGIGGLWRSMWTGMLLTPRSALNFFFVERLRPLFLRLRGGEGGLPPLWIFAMGCIADTLSTTIVWPLMFARLNQAVALEGGEQNPDRSISAILKRAVQSGGVSRIYAGLKNEILGVSLKGGIRWTVKDKLDAICIRLILRLVNWTAR